MVRHRFLVVVALCLSGTSSGAAAAGESPALFAAANLRFHAGLLQASQAPAALQVSTAFLQSEASRSSGSRGTVFLKSLLLPGWGQWSLGAKGWARGFFLAEVGLWSAVFGFRMYGNWLRDDYRAFAAAHAQVTVSGRDSQFWVDIGNFDSIYDYNDEKLRQRNVRDLRDPRSDDFWQWDSRSNRELFEDLRIASDRAYERSNFAIAAVVVNHLASAIHAMWVWKRSTSGSETLEQDQALHLRLLPLRDGTGLSASWRF